MQISFNIPQMLPNIVRGVCLKNENYKNSFRYQDVLNLMRSMKLKYSDTTAPKTQTCRWCDWEREGNKSKYMKLRAGDKLDLYWKAQSNKSSYIGPVICSSITKICLSQNFLYIFDPKEKQKFIPVDMHQFAKSDGFKNCNDMVNYFMSDNRVGSVWKGFLISW